jgi:glucose/arabinose dehydrogenase
MMPRISIAGCMLHAVYFAVLFAPISAAASDITKDLSVPAGFQLSLVTDKVPNVRELALGDNGTILAGSLSEGKVYAVIPSKVEGGEPAVKVIADNLRMPAGVAFQKGDLYVSATDKIVVLRDVEDHLDNPPKPVVVVDKLPYRDGDHQWKFIAVGPDNMLYIPIGAPCNVCEIGHEFGKLMRTDLDGKNREDVAYGIRNTVGFDWNPVTKKLWFTENGRDWLGQNSPSDELNAVNKVGDDFGFPYCHAGDIPDPEFGRNHSCTEFVKPVRKLGAHVAALGMRFYTGIQFPAEYRNAAIIAEHGSWNRIGKVGYRVVAQRFDASGNAVGEPTVLVDGFTHTQLTSGRPVDVVQETSGSILISDDYAGAIYRLSYVAK